jgi:short-subunit dehydrogenase
MGGFPVGKRYGVVTARVFVPLASRIRLLSRGRDATKSDDEKESVVRRHSFIEIGPVGEAMPPASPPSRPTSLVTGASSGIGAAFARALAARGHDLILTARRADRLEALAMSLRADHGATIDVIPGDLAAPGGAAALVAEVQARGLRVDWLINNAGYGVSGAFDASAWPVHEAFIRIMIEAPTELVRRLLPGMRGRGYGRIVNVSSLAAHVPSTAGHSLYPASKAYLVKFSQSLALENADAGVHACALCPGFTWSEFHDVTGTRATMNKMPAFMWLTAEEVVADGIAAVEAGTAVRIPGRLNRAIAAFVRLIPPGLAFRMTARQSHRWRDASREG